VDVRLSDEQRMVQDAARRLAADHASAWPPEPGPVGPGPAGPRSSGPRSSGPTGSAVAAGEDREGGAGWKALAAAGFLGLRLPEDQGGAGASAVEAALVAEQLAAEGAFLPYVGQGVLAAELLAAVGATTPAQEVADGTLRCAVQLTPTLDGFGSPRAGGVAFDAAGATHVLSVDAGGAVWLHELEGEVLAALDRTRVTVRSTPSDGARLLAGPGDLQALAADRRPRVAALALAMLSADMVGLSRRALDQAVAYVRQREQFGQAVGRFQAVQHLLADAEVRVEGARSALWHAAWAVDALGSADAALLAARHAKAFCGAAARRVVEAAIQAHGGIAVTWEHPMHGLLRRALTDDQVLGSVRSQHEAIAATRLSPACPPDATPAASRPAADGLDYADSPDEAAFRTQLRTWLADRDHDGDSDGDGADRDDAGRKAGRASRFGGAESDGGSGADEDEAVEAAQRWHRQMAAAGLVGLSFPKPYGGQGRTLLHEAILHDEMGAAGAPPGPAIGHITNAIRLFGSEEQKRARLPGMLACTERWCQGFSEPNAGSDLASLRTRGERTTAADGRDAYVVDGQKIWTSEAVWAHWCLLLLRTEDAAGNGAGGHVTDAPAHRGLSMLMVPMDTPGVEVRPIVTAYGSREFAEVFFDQAVVPAENVLGQPGQGWEIAMALLGFERGPGDIGWTSRLRRQLTLVEARVRSGDLDATPSQREALAHAWVELETLRLHVQRSASARLDGSAPGPEGSIDKLLMTDADQLLHHVLADLLGPEAVLDEQALFAGYVWARAQSIFGGTQQIQRNIVAQRVLGLPRP
jgi:alkylation response protein AidB-like acyl-CoA dehydrogenase